MGHLGSLPLVIAGLALLAGSMHLPMPAAAWIALLLILHGSRSLPARAAPPSVWLAATAILAIAERGSIPSSGPGYLLVVSSASFTLMLPFAIDRAVVGRSVIARVGSTLIFPIAFVAIEFLRSRVMPNATWGSIAYTQYGALPLMQIAAFSGIWGIIFLMTWSASTFDLAWRQGFASASARAPLMAFGCAFAVAIAAGTLRVGWASTDRPTLRAATLNRPPDLFVPGEMTRITEGRVARADRPSIDAKLAASGISGAFDPWGRVLGFTDFFAPGDRSLTVQLPVGGVRTMYARIGDTLGWLCVAALAATLAISIVRRAQSYAATVRVDPRPFAGSSVEGAAR